LRPWARVVLDVGALSALKDGKSLLPIGVVGVEGTFEKGDAVILKDAAGNELARGLSAYSSVDAEKIIGRRSSDIEAILGFRGRGELVHRDDMAVN